MIRWLFAAVHLLGLGIGLVLLATGMARGMGVIAR